MDILTVVLVGIIAVLLVVLAHVFLRLSLGAHVNSVVDAGVVRIEALLRVQHASTVDKIAAVTPRTFVFGGGADGKTPAGTITTPSDTTVEAIIKAGEAKIAAWGTAAIDWTQVTASALQALYQQAALARRTGLSTLFDYRDGRVFQIDQSGAEVPYNAQLPRDPNFEAQAAFLRGEPVSESTRAYVFHNNVKPDDADSINARFITAGDLLGNITVIART